MSMYVSIMECDLHVERKKDVYSVIDSEVVELSRMVLEVRDAGTHDQLYLVEDCNISWGSEEFEADVKWLQENGVRGYMIIDLEGGEFARYRLTDELVEKAAGRVYFSSDRELQHGPLMLTNEDIESLCRNTIMGAELGDEEKKYLLDNIQELEYSLVEQIMEHRFIHDLITEARLMLASREEAEEEGLSC